MEDRSVWQTSAVAGVSGTFLLLVEAQIAATFTSPFPAKGLLLSVLHELGIALLIAAVLNLTIEYINRRNLEATVERIKRAVHKEVLKKSLPSELIDECERILFNAECYRVSQRIWYKLEKIESVPNSVRLSAKWSYRVVNVTKEKVTYQMNSAVYVNPLCPDQCSIDRVAINDIDLSPEDLEKSIKRNDRVVVFQRAVTIPPEGFVKIDSSYRQVHTGQQSTETVCCLQPALDMQVEVHVPNEDFNVTCTSLHQADEVTADEHEGQTHFAWKLPRPALPGQGLLLEWSPKPASKP